VAEDYDVEVAELQAITQGDQGAFSRWFARCEIPLKRSLRSFAPAVDVEAVVQETAMKLWNGASRIAPDGRPGFLLRWGLTVARNEARNRAKRSARHVALEDHPEVAGATVNMAGDPILRARIRHCLERLQTHQQRAFRARLDDGGKHADRDLAALVGMSFDSFRQNLARGRKKLVTCLSSFKIDVMEYLR
jgi:RNA polymerase sigma factor (sigma-70 family)